MLCHFLGDLSFTDVLNRSIALDHSAHLFLTKNPEHNPSGDFSLTGSIVGYEEPRYTYSGISLLSPELFESLKPVAKEFPLRDILRTAILASRVSGEVFAGDWCDVGTIERYNTLTQRIMENDDRE
jgi:MurNAc alpha-1-phosphate uridylyltransferase